VVSLRASEDGESVSLATVYQILQSMATSAKSMCCEPRTPRTVTAVANAKSITTT